MEGGYPVFAPAGAGPPEPSRGVHPGAVPGAGAGLAAQEAGLHAGLGGHPPVDQ